LVRKTVPKPRYDTAIKIASHFKYGSTKHSFSKCNVGILQTGKFCQEVLTGLQIAMILVLLMAL
jgi:hypothetical protein